MYSKEVIKHFQKPHNYGKIKNPSGIGTVGNIVCGDVMKLYIKVAKNKNKQDFLKEIKYETFGCAAAIATSSIVTDLAKGKTIEQALKINNQEIVKSLKGLPPSKIHCSLLAVDALQEAIYDYLKKQKREIPQILEQRHQKLEKDKKEIERRYGQN